MNTKSIWTNHEHRTNMNTGQTYTLKKLTQIQGKTKMNTGQIDSHEDEHRTWKQEKHKHSKN